MLITWAMIFFLCVGATQDHGKAIWLSKRGEPPNPPSVIDAQLAQLRADKESIDMNLPNSAQRVSLAKGRAVLAATALKNIPGGKDVVDRSAEAAKQTVGSEASLHLANNEVDNKIKLLSQGATLNVSPIAPLADRMISASHARNHAESAFGEFTQKYIHKYGMASSRASFPSKRLAAALVHRAKAEMLQKSGESQQLAQWHDTKAGNHLRVAYTTIKHGYPQPQSRGVKRKEGSRN